MTRGMALMITGNGVHDPPESMFTIKWNECSRSTGIGVHDPPERANDVDRRARNEIGMIGASCSIPPIRRLVPTSRSDDWLVKDAR
jgi:hypothetical protein